MDAVRSGDPVALRKGRRELLEDRLALERPQWSARGLYSLALSFSLRRHPAPQRDHADSDGLERQPPGPPPASDAGTPPSGDRLPGALPSSSGGRVTASCSQR
jgi:hypothetical protein